MVVSRDRRYPTNGKTSLFSVACHCLVCNADPLNTEPHHIREEHDKTNLSGLFDIHVRFHRDTTDSASPSLFTALDELGLKLEFGKSPLGVVVIDSVRRLSEN